MCFVKTCDGFVNKCITRLKSKFSYDKTNLGFVKSRIGFDKREMGFVTELGFRSKSWVGCSLKCTIRYMQGPYSLMK